MKNNPLMNITFKNLDYGNISSHNFLEALDHYLPLAEKEYETFLNIDDKSLTWDNFEYGFQNERKLSYVYSLLNFYKSIDSSDDLNDVFVKFQSEINKFSLAQITNNKLYKKFLTFKESSHFNNLTLEQQKYITEYLISFEKNGVDLSDDKKEKLLNLNLGLSELKNNYNVNLQKSRDNLSFKVSFSQLGGLSKEHLNKAFTYIVGEGDELDIPYSSGLFSILLTYCDNKKVRKDVFELTSTIGISAEFNNIPIAQKIIELNQEIAELLGFKTASHMLMKGNMVEEPGRVLEFLSDLREKSHELYMNEIKDYEKYALNLIGENHEFSDRSYVLNKMYEDKYEIDTIGLSKYFPENEVLQGMFTTLNKLYDITIKPIEKNILNKNDIKVFSIFDSNDKHLGDLILDLYQRKGKRNGGCCGTLISKETYDNNSDLNSLPLVYIISNGEPSLNGEHLFSFDSLITLYHEVGHALHHFFSENKLGCFNGTSQVQRDAVELPSQFMENFCYSEEVLNFMSSHVDTKEKIPMDLINNIIKSKQFFANTSLMRHILASYIDIQIYSNKGCNIEEVEMNAIKDHITYKRI